MIVLHTRGPWRATDRRPVSGNFATRIPFAIEALAFNSVVPVADICDQPNCDINARLIAAAPELLEALQLFVEAASCGESHLGDMRDPLMRIARDAITKATKAG